MPKSTTGYNTYMIRVAVLRGGPSNEYDVSLATGAYILSILNEQPEKYIPVDIFISKSGKWHRSGKEEEPIRALRHVDVVWNALHGHYGEDGQVQRLLERLSVPFTGSGTFASALSMDKHLSKDVYRKSSLLTPTHELLVGKPDKSVLVRIIRDYLHPVVVKPSDAGSSIGVSLVYTLPELEIAVGKALMHSRRIMVEEYVRGKEASCGVVANARGEEIYALLPVEIRPPQRSSFFDYDAKYSAETEKVCPGNFSPDESEEIVRMAKEAHKVLGLGHFSRSDFIVTTRGRVYILETNSVPGMSPESIFPKALKAVGWHSHDFVRHCIDLALA